MTEWDKIWEYKGEDGVFYKILGRLKGTWDSAWFPWYESSRTLLEKIKVEGDRLQDELRRYKNSFHIIKLAGGKEVELAQKLEAIKTTRNKLYEALPTGNVDAFDLIKAINSHITELDKILEGEQSSEVKQT